MEGNNRAPVGGARFPGAVAAPRAIARNVGRDETDINSEPVIWQDAALLARQRYLCRKYLLNTAFAGIFAEAMAPRAGR